MILEVDPRSAVPPYAQIGEQVAALVQTGVLAPGARLPTIRQLAADLGVATGTVARAYRELEVAGVIASNGRHGTSVALHPAPPAVGPPEVVQAARRFAATSRGAGASLEQAIIALRAAYVTGGPA